MNLLLTILIAAVWHVTTLSDSGAGSLRSCVDAKGQRTCVFDVGGVISLKSNLVVTNPDLTIDGESSPMLVELRGAGLHISASNVTVQHIAIRPGDSNSGPSPGTRDALQITNYKTKKPLGNVLIDHCSFTWAIDENVSIYGTTVSNIRIANSIIAEPLYRSIHPKGPHSMGLLINPGAKNVLLQGNLFAHAYDRNPRTQDGVTLQMVNNAVYNWGGTSCWNAGLNLSSGSKLKGPLVNFVGNLHKPGKNSPKKLCPSIYNDATVPRSTKIYVRDNLGPTRTRGTQDEWAISGLPKSMQSPYQLMVLPSNFVPVSDLTDYLVANVGPRPRQRSDIDARIVDEFLRGEGTIKDCLTGCARPAEAVKKWNTRKK